MRFKNCETFLNQESLQYLKDLTQKIRENRVVLFAGAGLSRNARRKDKALNKKFPLWTDLMQKMLIKLYGKGAPEVKKQKNDYMNVPDKFEAQFGRNSLNQLLDEALEDAEFEPGNIHRLISQFNWEVITTNFDTLIERGYELTNKRPNLIYVDSDLSFINKPRIFKINGCIKHARSQIIITGEDFRTFSDKKPLIELYIKKCFIDSTILFVGFSLVDPAFKMIHGWVRDRLLDKKANRFAYSIQQNVDEATKKIWHERGIRFIELFPDGNHNEILTRQRHNFLLKDLYENQRPRTIDVNNGPSLRDPDFPDLLELFRESLKKLEKKASRYDADCQRESAAAQTQLEGDIQKLIQIKSSNLNIFFDICNEPYEANHKDKENEKKEKEKIIDAFIRVVLQYLCPNYKESILYHLLKRVLLLLEKEEKFENINIPSGLLKVFNVLMMKGDKIDNPDVWVMALYLAIHSGLHVKLPPIGFFQAGLNTIHQTVSKHSSENVVSIDLQRYWFFVLSLTGPFGCAKKLLDISSKTEIKKSNWEIPKEIQFHLMSFFDNWRKHLGLFLDAVNRARTSNKIEAYSLLDTFLARYEELGFSDLFISNTYQELTGEYRERLSLYRDRISRISYPIKLDYLKRSVQAVFKGLNDGKSLLFTEVSRSILSFPHIEIDKNSIEDLKKTSVGELFLMVVLMDLPSQGKKSRRDLERLITVMISTGIIDVACFLELLLLRLGVEDALKDIDQKQDNGVSRYFAAMASFLLCALPYLENGKLMMIKTAIQNNLANIQDHYIQEWLVHVIAYISKQLPGEDYSKIYETIFSIAAKGHHSSLGLKHILLKEDDLKNRDNTSVYYNKLRLILSLTLERQGTSADRDFIEFLLNHERNELFKKDKSIDKTFELYLSVRYEETNHLSYQWLMDFRRFIEKGYIPLDPKREKQIKEYIDATSNNEAVGFEWRQVSMGMFPVYKDFAKLFDIQLIERIIDEYLKEVSGEFVQFKDLDYDARQGYVRLLKEVYECTYHDQLKPKVVEKIKQFVKSGFTGGGYVGVFWKELDKKEQDTLAQSMLSMWQPQSDEEIERAVTGSGEFLMYETDEQLVQELSIRLIYAAFTGSRKVKTALLELFVNHANIKTPWFKNHEAKIVDLLDYFKNENDLEVLRELIKLLKTLKPAQTKQAAQYLHKQAPFAEIRREASRLPQN
jgi:hypothetical protein